MGIGKDLIAGVLDPISKVLTKRSDRKINRDSIKGKVAQQKQGDATAITLSDGEWETVGQSMQDKTWKDEYVTVSLVSILNLFVIGGILTAFGYPQMLSGVTIGVSALVAAGVDIGLLITAVVFAALGLKMWRA